MLLSRASFFVLYNVGSKLNEILECDNSAKAILPSRTYRPVVLIISTSSRGLLEWRAYISTLQLYNRYPLKHISFLVVEMWLGTKKAK